MLKIIWSPNILVFKKNNNNNEVIGFSIDKGINKSLN